MLPQTKVKKGVKDALNDQTYRECWELWLRKKQQPAVNRLLFMWTNSNRRKSQIDINRKVCTHYDPTLADKNCQVGSPQPLEPLRTFSIAVQQEYVGDGSALTGCFRLAQRPVCANNSLPPPLYGVHIISPAKKHFVRVLIIIEARSSHPSSYLCSLLPTLIDSSALHLCHQRWDRSGSLLCALCATWALVIQISRDQ